MSGHDARPELDPAGRTQSEAPLGALRTLMDAFAQGMPDVLDEVAVVLREPWPDYASFLDDHRVEVLTAALATVPQLTAATDRALAVSGGEPDWQDDVALALFEEIGATEARAGVPLTSLLGAFQAGARTAWHHAARLAVGAEAPLEVVTALADVLFLFVDRLSAAASRGYLRERSLALGAREARRGDLVALLLSERATAEQVAAAATSAGWQLPAGVALVLVPPADSGGTKDALGWVEAGWLQVRAPGLTGAIVPDADAPGARSRLAARLAGLGAVVARTVPPSDLPATIPVAQIALRLSAEGVLTGDPVFVLDELDTIIVHQNERLLQTLRDQCLAPLDACRPATRERLELTLESWLRHNRDRHAVAAELHVHPQTVRYRLGQLRELFGNRMTDPNELRKLKLALGWGSPRGVPAQARRPPED